MALILLNLLEFNILKSEDLVGIMLEDIGTHSLNLSSLGIVYDKFEF